MNSADVQAIFYLRKARTAREFDPYAQRAVELVGKDRAAALASSQWVTALLPPQRSGNDLRLRCPCCGAPQPAHSAIAYCDDCNRDTCGHHDLGGN